MDWLLPENEFLKFPSAGAAVEPSAGGMLGSPAATQAARCAHCCFSQLLSVVPGNSFHRLQHVHIFFLVVSSLCWFRLGQS